MSTSDGSTADYYELPAGATELQDLISHRNLNAQDGEIFRAIYRKGRASHSDELRDARKVLFYAQAEVKRLEKLAATPSAFGQQNMIDPADVDISEKSAKCKGCFAGCRDCCPGLAKIADEKLARRRAASAERFVNECVGFLSEPASAIDDDSERMQAIGQNGNGGEHYGAPDWSTAPDNAVAYIDWTGSAARFASAFYSDGGDRFYRLDDGIPTRQYVLKLDDGRMDIDYPYFMRHAK